MLLTNNGTTTGFNPVVELCAGMKFKFPKYKVYNRKFARRKGDRNIYKFESLGVKEDMVSFIASQNHHASH